MKGRLKPIVAALLAMLAALATWLLVASAPAMAYPLYFTHLSPPISATRSTTETITIAAVITAFVVVAVVAGVRLDRRARRPLAEVTSLSDVRQQDQRRKAA